MGFSMRLTKAPKNADYRSVSATRHAYCSSKASDRKPAQLSGGCEAARGHWSGDVREPKVFLFDEPLSNLDAELRVQMRAELAQLHRRLGNGFHDLRHA